MIRRRHIFCRVLLITALSAWSCAWLVAAESAAPAPEISLSLRGVAEEIVEQGEPLRIVVRLDAPRDSASAIELAPTSGAWSEAITVELASASGGVAVARAQAVGQSETRHATLNPGRVAGGLWRLSADAMQRIAPGDYVVRARLTISSGRGWTGEVVSDETPIQVVAVSGSADRVTQRTVNRARDALLSEQIEEAAKIIDTVLEHTPDDETLLTVRADIAERAGNPNAAMICLNRFLRLRTGLGTGQPPIEVEELRTRILGALLADNAPTANPPAWSWPPAAVLALPADEMLPSVKPGEVSSVATATTPNPPVTAPTSPGVKPTDSAVPTPPVATASSYSGVGSIVPSTELNDATILADTAGQWAASARASSEYGTPRYGAGQATGAPNIPLGLAGDNPDAWCPAEKNAGSAWLELTFAKPVHATEVRVRQNNAPGAIAKVEVISPDGTTHVWWQGVDPFVEPRVREIAWFAVRVPRTDHLVARVKLTLNLATVPGWKQIDAVQLVGAAP
jgi:hypothetical protein